MTRVWSQGTGLYHEKHFDRSKAVDFVRVKGVVTGLLT